MLLRPFSFWRNKSIPAEALAHITRITTDGGSVTDAELVGGIIADLKAGGTVNGTSVGNCYDKLDWLFIPAVACKKDGAGRASKVYDLSPTKGAGFGTGGYYDAVQGSATNRMLVVTGIDGIPALGSNEATGSGYAVSGTIQTVAQPTAVFAVGIREGTRTDVWQFFFDSSVGGGDRQCFSYQVGGSNMEMYAGAAMATAATQTTWGVFSSFMNGASSNIKRGATTLGTGNVGGQSRGSSLSFLNRYTFNSVWGGRCAFFATAKSGITQNEVDFVVSVLRKYFPSAT